MKKHTLLAVALTIGSLTACKDSFLDVQPKAVLGAQNFYNSTGVNYLLVGAYSLLDGWGSGGTSYHSGVSNWVFGSVSADDAYKGSTTGDQPDISYIEYKSIQPDNGYFRGKWRSVYDGVARSNDVLQAVEKATDMSATDKTQVQAQARFLRAYYHFEAKKMWNMAPYIDDKTYNPTDLNSTKVPNDKDIWSNIEADLKFAAENLPAKQSQVGRATKWAATAMLAKAYVFQKKWTDAKPLLESIIASGQYKLMDKYHDNFRTVTNNNTESIFEVQFSVNDGTGENGNNGDVLNYPYGGPTTCCGFFQPSQNLVNAFKTDATGLPLVDTFNNSDITSDQGLESTQAFTPYTGALDPRLDWTVGRRGIPFLDWGAMPGKSWVRDQGNGGPYVAKKHLFYKSDVGTNTFASNNRLNANNFRMIKLSHIYLWLAEAEVEAGSPEKAREYVNVIRKRASNPDGFVKTDAGQPAANYVIGLYTQPWSDKVAARKAVQFEHRLEFALEGHRYFDLVRWGIAAETLNAYMQKESVMRTYFKGASFIKGKHEYYPIPLQEILNSKLDGKETLKQNPGY
ncbi:RagB/SusD family nutrient uptake outer membrane protein [Tellurirhabdus bombi]|uniref:RagB/SusD family nutrient uptake outer membrane protein n=1 Tax=Tellurirhabdus bombi TaxID=2907205 RepID=UPI001F37BD91|nr:RagB/SusD family nutrient uptake outer membrane protein [Tellurirhabdus bombi]